MQFASLPFLIFFLVIFIIFYIVKKKHQILILFLSSIIFLSLFSVSFLFYAVVFIIVNYFSGIQVNKITNLAKKKIVFYFAQTFNIGGILIYKYIDFFIENLNSVTSFFQISSVSYWHIIAPLGISYYTFQGISYLYLVYKTNDTPEYNILNFSIYMLFWPKLLAGPIERHRNFLPQIHRETSFDYDRITDGIRLFMWGMFKKIVVGDTFAIVLNKVYGDITFFQGIPLILTFVIQPIQIYCDFSGYTDMALGLGKVFGFKLTDNFKRPLLAQSVGDFWRRWHISLSAWCNDFIYNRLLIKHRKWGKKSAIYSIFMSFIVIGIWHGAKWTFIFLGLMQAMALSYEFLFKKERMKIGEIVQKDVLKWLNRMIIYMFYSSSLVFFFAHDIYDVSAFGSNIGKISNITNTSFGFNILRSEFYIAFISGILIIVRDVIIEDYSQYLQFFNKMKGYVVVRWFMYIVWLFLIVYFSKNQSHFVYMQF